MPSSLNSCKRGESGGSTKPVGPVMQIFRRRRWRIVSAIACVLLACSCRSGSSVPPVETLVEDVLRSTPLIDGHNDLIIYYTDCSVCPREPEEYDLAQLTTGRTDIPRWRQGRLGAQLLNAGWQSGEEDSEATIRGFELVSRLAELHSTDLVLARTADDVREAHREGKIAILLALENPGRFRNDPDLVRQFAGHGLRSNILAYNDGSDLADGWSGPARHGGLSDLGRVMVREMNRSGVLVDLSHASAATARDVLEVSRAPVIFSHSSVRALADTGRNVADDVLLRLRGNGGLIMISFVAQYTTPAAVDWYQQYYATEDSLLERAGADQSGIVYWTRASANWYGRFRKFGRFVLDDVLLEQLGQRSAIEKAMDAWELEHPQPLVTVSDVADHFDHVRRLVGVDHVGIGSDFDGDPSVIEGLEDVSRYPNLLLELARRGWTEEELKKVAGENFLRVLEQAERVASGSEPW